MKERALTLVPGIHSKQRAPCQPRHHISFSLSVPAETTRHYPSARESPRACTITPSLGSPYLEIGLFGVSGARFRLTALNHVHDALLGRSLSAHTQRSHADYASAAWGTRELRVGTWTERAAVSARPSLASSSHSTSSFVRV